jgi:hypothetical protein
MSMFDRQLTQIVNLIEIAPDLTISHPHYPPAQLDPAISARFTQIPIELQTKFLIDRVRNYLYDLYFTGSSSTRSALAAAAPGSPSVKNNLTNGVDIDFYRRLQQSNTSRGYLDLDWQIVAETADGELVVVKDGLHLHIDRQWHLPQNLQQAAIGETLPIFLPPNLVGRDTYIMVGDGGSPQRDDLAAPDARLVRLYFNFTPDAAISIGQQLTGKLNQLGIPFEFAILHDSALFYRYDAATLWLSQANYLIARSCLVELYRSHRAEFSNPVPLCTKQLAPGLGIAEVPLATDSFGLHRCQLIAEGLVAAFLQQQSAIAAKLDLIESTWNTAQLARSHPHLNPSTADCYEPFGID